MDSKRIYGLDVLRTIAILTVVVRHMFSLFGFPLGKAVADALYFNGVFMFFVLSGYLIGSILLRTFSEKEATPGTLATFWRDRWLRTLPAYYCVLLLLVGVAVLCNHRSLHEFRFVFIFSENLNDGEVPLFGESWSLAVEEWFYLVIPVLLFIGIQMGSLKRVVPVIIAGIFIFSLTVKLIRIHQYGINNYDATAPTLYRSIAYSVPTRIDCLLFGLLGAYLQFYAFRIWNSKNTLFAIGITGFLLNHFYKVYTELNFYNLYLQEPVELLCIAMTLPKLTTIKTGKGAIAKTVTFIASTSYAMYLVHNAVFQYLLLPQFPHHLWLQITAYFIWAIGGAYLLYITVEKAGLQVRKRLRATS